MPDCNSSTWSARTLALATAILTVFCVPAGPRPAIAQADETAVRTTGEPIAAGQTLDIRVGRWDSVEEAFLFWEGLGGEFLVGQDGTLTLPLIGPFDAVSMRPDELGSEIAERLQRRLGMRSEVQAVVTIAAFAPVYVLGDVRSPGSFDHAPGMTVLQALSLAGGIDTPGAQLLQGDRSALTSLGAYQVMEVELLQRLATLARLQAELQDADIDPPEDLASAPMGEDLIEQEREILEARRTALQSSLSQIDDLEALLEDQITRLERQSELRQEQLELLEASFADASSLLDRGLSTSDRVSALQRQLADQRVRLLEVETAALNAEQRLNETRRDRLELTNQRRRELVEGVKDQRATIRELKLRMQTEAALFADSSRMGTRVVDLLGDTTPTMQITRGVGDGSETFTVDRSDAIRGGDVLEVILPALDPYSDVVPAPSGAMLDGLDGPASPSVDLPAIGPSENGGDAGPD